MSSRERSHRQLTKCIAFHSYKGGTGKTTLACNAAAALAKKGCNVCLLDLDIYAPSFQIYFQKDPKRGINDYLDSNASIEDIMLDVTDIFNSIRTVDVKNNNDKSSTASANEELVDTGKLSIGFSNPKKKDVFNLEMAEIDAKRDTIRRFMRLRESLISDYGADYIILDTSPGMRFWSINSLAIADTLILTLKSGELDIEGTKKVVDEIYSSFTKYGSRAFLLCNRIAGYCVPHSSSISPSPDTSHAIMQLQEEQMNDMHIIDRLSTELGIPTISSIPCFCDIQFLRREFMTVLKYPRHPFAEQIRQLIDKF